mmetsp:Transcript_5285/g.8134  ORF Transcript_5285/g.8134 Transcript_5285/m.8134 type:complete len:379 (-) Transcript_5285:1697-2833(-)
MSRRASSQSKPKYVGSPDSVQVVDDDSDEDVGVGSMSSSGDDESDYETVVSKKKKLPTEKKKGKVGESKVDVGKKKEPPAKREPANKGARKAAEKKSVSKRKVEKVKAEKSEVVVKKKARVMTEADKDAALEQSKALRVGQDLGMVSSTRPPLPPTEGLPFPKAVANCSNSEIKVRKVKRGEQKYLFIFPGQLSVGSEGVCGTLENIGSSSPVLNIGYPDSGRVLRLNGSVVNPSNSYLMLKFNMSKNAEVNCGMAYSDVVIFHSYQWVDDNGAVGAVKQFAPSGDGAADIDWDRPSVLGTTYSSISLSAPQAASAGDNNSVSVDEDISSSGSDIEVLNTQDSAVSVRSSSRKRMDYRAQMVSPDEGGGGDSEDEYTD